ncbi:hypothetical protein ACJMK2_020885 [Sinanodonta woodiana]|uniref:TIR domain-containing protein n=1 Tax=Sinanodonta woodiana TaxID=1069815 RepID=A0ABD3U1L3_SINWO
MEVDVVINGQLTENAAITEEHVTDHKVDRRPLSKNKTYHVFVCYRDITNDKLWAKEVVKKLENDLGFICLDHERDFLAGSKVIDNIKYGIMNSEKVVCVLSKEGLESEYLKFETELAHKESMDKRENLLIPVLLDVCEIPEELKLLTYIDARKEISETTWWPKLVAAIEAKAKFSFFKGIKEEETSDNSENKYCQQLCSLETTFSCTQCSVQSTSKYIPKELVSMNAVVPVDTIKNIKKDLLDAQVIKCKQRCSWLCTGLLILFVLTCLTAFGFTIELIIECATIPIISKENNCFFGLGLWVAIEIFVGISFSLGFRRYYKVPLSIDQKIAEYNSELIKNGILITLVCTRKWRKASIVFYRVSFDSCKQYIICHLREDKQPERETLVNISETEAQTYADDIPILTRSENEDLAQATQTLHCRHDTIVDTFEMPENHIEDDVPLLDLVDNDQLDQRTEVHPQNVGLRQRDDDQGSTIVNLNDQENRPQQVTPNSEIPQNSDVGGIENIAMRLLLTYAHEYLRQVFNGKMKNPKEDRHIPDCTCLCQYIEKQEKKFRKIIDKNKNIHSKNSHVEHNTKKILDAVRL